MNKIEFITQLLRTSQRLFSML